MRGGFTRLVQGFEVESYCRAVAEDRITAAFLVPTLIYALIDAQAVRARYDLSSLDMIVYGAAPMSPDRLREAMRIFGNVFVQMMTARPKRRNAVTTDARRSSTTTASPADSSWRSGCCCRALPA